VRFLVICNKIIQADTRCRANSLADNYLQQYRNALSLIVPAIRQVGYYARISQDGELKQLAGLSISAEGSLLLRISEK
jgi:Tfp pilus assembly protein PilW